MRYDDEDEPGFVPLPFDVIGRLMSPAHVNELVSAGLLDRIDHEYRRDYGESRCRAYAAGAVIAEAMDAAFATSLDDPLLDIVGMKKTARARKTSTRTDGRQPLPDLISESMQATSRGLINQPSFQSHLSRLRAVAMGPQEGPERVRHQARWRNDLAAYKWIKAQRLTETHVLGVYSYPHAWTAQGSGRIMSRGEDAPDRKPRGTSGPQSITREGKAAKYAGIPGLHNYDLRSSQPRIFPAEAESRGIVCGWLREYLADPEAKRTWAREVGCSVDTWKALLLAAMIGGRYGLPPLWKTRTQMLTVSGERRSREVPVSASMRALAADLGAEEAEAKWPSVRENLEPLVHASSRLQGSLVREAQESSHGGRGGRYYRNAAGMSLALDGLTVGQMRRKLVAHVLQGREALYIHALAAAAERHGFVVVCNEHDGLVTLGEVPEAAKEEAGEAAEMPWAELVEKPFV